jgi:pimeloyl-ACP methyl ester carboxylesterase
MSLGGYTSALLATVEPELAFSVPIIPLASIADFARAGGRLVGTEEQQLEQHAALEAAYRVVSPLGRPSRIDAERILVLGAEADRITPLAHARRLAAHFDARMEIFPGGHLLQFGRAEAFRAVARLLGRLGLLSPRR